VPGGTQAGTTDETNVSDEIHQVLEDLRIEARRTAQHRREEKSWLEQRVGLHDLYTKYGRKAFPVHSTYFFGEMAMFAFVILVLTGIYLGLLYVPSSAEVQYVPEGAPTGTEGYTLPESYASILLIESIPVANLLRNVHHWTAHVMIISILLHTGRIFFSGTYRKPREITWIFGVVLLLLTLGAAFFGYALPFDSYALTATTIGYSIARSIPLIGEFASEFVFGGNFPTLGSLPRMYTLHIVVIPVLIALALGAHLILVLKTKHSQPGYARKVAEPGRVLGVPLWPYQALFAGQLVMLMFGALLLLAAFVPPHPVEAYGPPNPNTPEVKPDWYLMWLYGLLKITPAFELDTPIGAITPDFVAGLIFPALLFLLLAIAPFLDRTNRGRHVRRYEYYQPPAQAPVRLTIGVAVISYILMLLVAAYYDDPLGLTVGQMWFLSLPVPLVLATLTYVYARSRLPKPEDRFDPTGFEDEEEYQEAIRARRLHRATSGD
jgi:cytochrome b-561